MCGIFGYAGEGANPEALIEGIKRLEYRGYDSWGVCVACDDHLSLLRRVGRIGGVDASGLGLGGGGSCVSGIAHTRWATHGAPTEANAHPHVDCAGRIAVIHNGIIENHASLRATLQGQGHVFASETDTEVIPHLIEEFLKSEPSFSAAFLGAMKLLVGAYGIAAAYAGSRKQSSWRGTGAPSCWGSARTRRSLQVIRRRWWRIRGTSSTWMTEKSRFCTGTGSRPRRWKEPRSARASSRLPSAFPTSSAADSRTSCSRR